MTDADKNELVRSNASRRVLLAAIDEISGLNNRGVGFAKFQAHVTAEVRGKAVVQRTPIVVTFGVGAHRAGKIGIYWEDHGVSNYRDLGLYGEMDTNFQTVQKNGNRSIVVLGDSYRVQIDY